MRPINRLARAFLSVTAGGLLLFAVSAPERAESVGAEVADSFGYPIAGYTSSITQQFGEINYDYEGKVHVADDVGGVAGSTPVYATASGTVMLARSWKTCPNWGHIVVIEHTLSDGTRINSVYGHLDPATVEITEGQDVSKGQVIGTVGEYSCWGDHLHFGLRVGTYGTAQGVYPAWLVGYLAPNDFPGSYVDPVAYIESSQQFVDCGSQAAVPTSECDALVALYDSTNGEEWTNSGGWLSTNGICFWYGVTCDTGHITRVEFFDNNISGVLPSALDDLTNLTYLSLSNNQLSGSIPAELGNLTNLTTLLLGNNQLSGSIPAELGNLTNLTNLWLYDNQLSGSIPAELGNLTNLTHHLLLYDNQLSGSIPAELGNLTNLTTLYLHGNQLSGAVPVTLLQLDGTLQFLQLFGQTGCLTSTDQDLVDFIESFDPNWDDGCP